MKINEEKKALRAFFLEKRSKISKERKEEAQQSCYDSLMPELELFTKVLSYWPLKHELSTKQVNLELIQREKLYLPRVIGKEIAIFQVTSTDLLEKSSFGVYEPSDKNLRLPINEIDCILVPGLGFDMAGHRLGYGEGYYDRLLLKSKKALKIGVGFQEQLSTDLFPIFKHDVKLDRVELF